jgi:hypothetical protein
MPEMPVESLREALPLLRRPFTPEAVKWKVQNVFKDATGAVLVAYIDARLVIERLNLVAAQEWTASYEPVGDSGMWCHLHAFEVTRTDFGSGSGFERDKARVSDSLKRAAVHFGIGVSVYALPQVTVWANKAGDRLERREVWDAKAKAKKPTLVLTPDGHAWLREAYRERLQDPEGFLKAFGEPLDHGDVADAGGMEDEPVAEEFVAERPAPLEDDRAKQLIEDLSAEYLKVDKEKVPPGKYQAWLGDAAHSHAELERLLTYLRSMT